MRWEAGARIHKPIVGFKDSAALGRRMTPEGQSLRQSFCRFPRLASMPVLPRDLNPRRMSGLSDLRDHLWQELRRHTDDATILVD